ncbi:MAG TPA: diaminopimelate decarboxylase [Candidatus Eisenbacteria bacterium]|jgi:diaminopimelate decarboxylase|nr:diaminopimelate decarboxylase [Candidatus Eisenbacteria bacterium]
MHRFEYRGNEFYCEDARVSEIAKKVGTPFYLYSIGTFLDHFHKLRDAFAPANPLICFSVKANSNLTVLKALVSHGSGLDVVSGGELYRAKKVGVKPEKIVFASVGKTASEIEQAVRAGILMFNVETIQELDVINSVATKLKKIQKVAIRLNPDVAPDTHHYISTGVKHSKFGIDMVTAYRLYTDSMRYPSLRFAGVHIHIGSQITESAPFVKAIKKALDFIDRVRAAGNPIQYLNIGGGLGIVYSKEKPQTAKEFAAAVLPLFKKHDLGRGLKIILEPGRFISGNSGILVTKVIYEKVTPAKSFVIVDGGMNDLIRPSLYGAHHEILPVVKRPGRRAIAHADVVGPVCESGDFLAKDRKLEAAGVGDLLAVMSCGAYGFVMSSNYNSRPRVPEIVVRGRRFFVARRRETLEDLTRNEVIVSGAVK